MLLISAPLPDLTSEQGIHYPKYGHPNGFAANLHFLFHFFGPQLKAWSKTVCKHLAMTNQRNGKENYLILVRRQIKLRIFFYWKSKFCYLFNSTWNMNIVQPCMTKATFFSPKSTISLHQLEGPHTRGQMVQLLSILHFDIVCVRFLRLPRKNRLYLIIGYL